jgi:hypothetical protein
MKKARLMLSALGIAAVLSSAFAFTANKFSSHFIYTGALNSGKCQTQLNGAAISNGTASVAASTTSLASGCPNAFTTEIAD